MSETIKELLDMAQDETTREKLTALFVETGMMPVCVGMASTH